MEIFGPDGDDVVLTGEFPQDRQRASDFAAEAREKKTVSVDPKKGNRAFLLVGNEDWPFPVPLVKLGDKWNFDAKAGRQELLYRRIGSNELDAIDICHGYVEAQYDYAFQKRQGYEVNQYAQRIISASGKQDGLAWQNPDGSWGGPVGEKIARAIEQGYSADAQPYHGYYFKILKGQGPAAPLGEMNYVVEGAMIGGFALVAAPAEYGLSRWSCSTRINRGHQSWRSKGACQEDLAAPTATATEHLTIVWPVIFDTTQRRIRPSHSFLAPSVCPARTGRRSTLEEQIDPVQPSKQEHNQRIGRGKQ